MHKVREGDLVRIKLSGGWALSEQRYKVESLGLGTDCIISEWPGIAGKRMAGQDFDTSLLVVDNSSPTAATVGLVKPTKGKK